MATKKKPTSKLNEAVRKIGNLAPLEAMLPPVDEPKPMPAPLLPPRWWDHAGASSPSTPAPAIITVSPQVAEVLNIGIDRAIDVATRLRGDYEYVQGRLNVYRWNEERLRSFLRNASDRLAVSIEPSADDDHASALETVNDAIVAVCSAIGTVLEEPMP